jgi:hypothetical protein
MLSARWSGTASPALVAGAAFLGMFLAGCNEHVQIIKDHDIRIARHATWAWAPASPQRVEGDATRGNRPVISRDVIGRRGEEVRQENDPAVEIERREVRTELERQLTAKGLRQVSDPAAADFLVDYHFAVRRRNATVPYAYGGYYPGLVCGPFGCYGGWGYGPTYVGYEHVRFREGTFVFDFVKQPGHQLAYRAIGEEPVHKAQFSHDQIEDMVHALLKDLKTAG